MLNEGNQIRNFISSSGSGTVINYVSGSDFLTSYGSVSASQKIMVPVPQHWLKDLASTCGQKSLRSSSLGFLLPRGHLAADLES